MSGTTYIEANSGYQRNMRAFVCCGVVIAIGVIIGGSVALSGRQEEGLSCLLIGFLAFLLILHPAIKLLKRKFDPFESMNLVIANYFIFFVLGPLGMFTPLAYRFFVGDNPFHWLNMSLFYSIIGFVCIYLGYLAPVGGVIARGLPAFNLKWSKTKLKTIILFYTLLALLCYAWLVHLGGGFWSFIGNIGYLRWTLLKYGTGYIIFGIWFLVAANIIWHLWATQHKGGKLLLWLHTLMTLALFVTLGGRSAVIGIVMVIVAIYHYAWKRISLRKLLIILLVMVIFAQVFVVFRWYSPAEFKEHLFNPAIALKFWLGDISSIRVFMRILEGVPAKLDYQLGRTYLNAPLFLVPRRFFPDKPSASADLVVEALFPEYHLPGGGHTAALPPTMPGELYLNFSIVGIILGMFLFGIFCKVGYSYLLKNTKKEMPILIYAVLVPLFLAATSGDFTIAARYLFTTLVPILMAIVFMGLRTSNVKHVLGVHRGLVDER